MPAAYGAGFVHFLPLHGRWRRREAGDTAGTGAWSDLVPVPRWEECREGASGDEDGPRMPVVSCPCSAPVGTHTNSGSGNHSFPSTRRGKHRMEIPTHRERLNITLSWAESPVWTSPTPHTDVGACKRDVGSVFGRTPTPLKYGSKVCGVAEHKCSWEKYLKVPIMPKCSSLP